MISMPKKGTYTKPQTKAWGKEGKDKGKKLCRS